MRKHLDKLIMHLCVRHYVAFVFLLRLSTNGFGRTNESTFHSRNPIDERNERQCVLCVNTERTNEGEKNGSFVCGMYNWIREREAIFL